MIGACLGGAAVEVAGRKKSIIVFTIPIILGWIFVGVEYNFIMTFTGRFLTGKTMTKSDNNDAISLKAKYCCRSWRRSGSGWKHCVRK